MFTVKGFGNVFGSELSEGTVTLTVGGLADRKLTRLFLE